MFTFDFNIKENVFDIDCNKEVVSNNIKKEKAIYDELYKFVDGKSNENKDYFAGSVDFDLIDLNIYEDVIFLSGFNNRRMFFAKNKIEFIRKILSILNF